MTVCHSDNWWQWRSAIVYSARNPQSCLHDMHDVNDDSRHYVMLWMLILLQISIKIIVELNLSVVFSFMFLCNCYYCNCYNNGVNLKQSSSDIVRHYSYIYRYIPHMYFSVGLTLRKHLSYHAQYCATSAPRRCSFEDTTVGLLIITIDSLQLFETIIYSHN